MLLRDDPDPAKRDGITDFINLNPAGKEEITTYDSLDHSLRPADRNGYIAMKSWAAYLALEAIFQALNDGSDAATAKLQAGRVAASIVANWKPDEGYLPAVFDGKSTARILPVAEGLIFPYEMGLAQATARTGPYGELLRVLHDHVNNVLRPGVCLDATTGAWKLSSTSQNTWQSKVYLTQFIAERILGIKDERVVGKVDQVHASFEVCGAAEDAWSDQLDSTSSRVLGSDHYPRGVTSALWWLDARNASVGQ
jgi:hypothetical protein